MTGAVQRHRRWLAVLFPSRDRQDGSLAVPWTEMLQDEETKKGERKRSGPLQSVYRDGKNAGM